MEMAKLDRKQAKESAPDWRDEFNMSLARAKALDQGTSVRTVLSNTQRIQHQQKLGQAARRIRNRTVKQAVTYATATDPITGEIIRLDDQQSMVEAMAETNRRRQQQCSNTPFSQPPLVNLLGSLIDEENATAIRDGTFVPPPGTPEGARKLIEVLKMPDSVRELGEIDFEESADKNAAAW